MSYLRHATKLFGASKLSVTSTSQIFFIRLSSNNSTKFLRQFDKNQIHVIRTVRIRNTRGPTSTQQPIKEEKPFVKSKVPPKPATSVVRKGLIAIGFCVTFIGFTSIIYAQEKMAINSNPVLVKVLEAEPLELEAFLQHVLPTGEVARIVYYSTKRRAVARLHQNGIFNSKSDTIGFITLKVENLRQLQKGIKNAEKKLGIQPDDGIHVDLFARSIFLKTLAFMVGSIFGALAFRYGYTRQSLQKFVGKSAMKK